MQRIVGLLDLGNLSSTSCYSIVMRKVEVAAMRAVPREPHIETINCMNDLLNGRGPQ